MLRQAMSVMSGRLAVGSRCVSSDVSRSFKERESALENLYFSKEEEKLLRNLLKKMKGQADLTDKDADKHNTQELKAVEGIVGKYNMSKDDLAELLKWKHSH